MRITPSVGGLFLSWVAGTAAFGDFNPDDPIPDEIMVGTITARAEVVSTGLVSPNLLLHAGDASGRLFVVDQIGAVRLIKHGELLVTPFLDQRTAMPALHPTDERGFTGMAFHPDFADPQKPGHGKFYTFANERIPRSRPIPILDFTSVPLPQGISPEAHSVLREWTMSDPSDDVFTGTTREVVRILQPHHAHCGACVQFGPDGMLYIGLGDGGTHDDQGPGHDPVTGNAQNNSYIYGKILRIDPFGNDSVNGKYGIPPDNPFVGDSNALDEIFLFGLRNPFRFSFEIDATGNKTTQLVIADTGQDDIEEVSRVDVAVDAGANLGWRIKEGTFLFAPGPESGPGERGRITENSPGVPADMIDPVVQYDHRSGGEGTAVIGGFTYQGCALPELRGMYVFGDFNDRFSGVIPNGRLFYADLSAPNPQIIELRLEGEMLSAAGGLSMFIKGFGVDAWGELYVLGGDNSGNVGTSGVVIRLTGPSVEPEICDNDEDDDCDNAIDCEDSDCDCVVACDGTDPTIMCPVDVTASTDAGVCEASGVDLGTPTTDDDCAVLTVAADALAVYLEGDTSVTWTVTDAAGNTASCSQTVTVTDDEPPTITCPENIVNVEPTGIAGAVVRYAAPVGSDNCLGKVITQTGGLGTGALFPIGITIETFTVTDHAGNAATCSFAVSVLSVQEVVEKLVKNIRQLVHEGTLSKGQGNGLTRKLERIMTGLDDATPLPPICNQLEAFMNQVDACMNNGSLTKLQRDALIKAASHAGKAAGCTRRPHPARKAS